MAKVVFFFGIGIAISFVVTQLVLKEPPPENMYGGVNYTAGIIGAKLVFIPDSTGTIKCSYAVDRDIKASNMYALDCEDGQSITYIGD